MRPTMIQGNIVSKLLLYLFYKVIYCNNGHYEVGANCRHLYFYGEGSHSRIYGSASALRLIV